MDNYSALWGRAAADLWYGRPTEYAIVELSQHKNVPKLSTVSGNYDTFLGQLPKSDCRWALLLFTDEPVDGCSRGKFCFVSWLPEDAPAETAVRYRFHQAEHFDSLWKAVDEGFQHIAKTIAKIDARSYEDLAYEAVLEEVNRRIES
ncbi:hypothetical protein [Nocardia asiatica]|uniref:hypothetical protein n=1 Tax=Nocardia asiatica TaxID=209252 RepID=UPI002455EF07|nr:hypothetical protein [Nocardia asiatica]